MQIQITHKAATNALRCCTCLLVLGLVNGAALAQEDELEEITVTGSRIARDPNLGAPVAVQSVTSEDIQLSGEMDVTEVVREIPALMTSNSADMSVNNTEFDTGSGVVSSAGEAVLQLRGMGLERTLVLVDGRRHVAGAVGTSAVDINTIPQGLIERVEVLTGGASAIYGADAVTGVVNFIMKDDFEGLEFNVQGGISGEGDGEDYRLSGLWGTNFAGDRGNFAVSVDYRKREPVRQGDRGYSQDNRIASDDNNPALRFQQGDLSATTPNLSSFYTTARGYYPFGQRIPTMDDFIADYTADFGAAPNLTAEEMALFDRALNSPTRAILRQRTFSISSEGGVIVPADFTFSGLDLNGNGNEDCLDSFLGFNSLLEGTAFGLTGGCWNIDQGGAVRVYEDGLVAGNFNQFGGDGVHAFGYDPDYLTLDDEQITVNLQGRYDITNDVSFFAEAKYVTRDTFNFGVGTGFYDLLTVAPDNPFIPAPLQPIAAGAGGFFITRDPQDLGGSNDKLERETSRFVVGLEGEFDNGWGFEFSLNRGQTNITQFDHGATIMDRYFAAIDVTTDAGGNPICRSELDGSLAPTTVFDLPLFDFGFFTFNPGDGSCVPLNILNGPSGATQQNIDWMMTTAIHEYELEQTVLSGVIDGDTGFGFDAGNIAFAVGTEFRIERSSSSFDPLTRGECPVSTPDCQQGQLVRDLPAFRQTSLLFDPEFLVSNSSGSYDVWELFGEVEVPLLAGV
ncbi:MAG: TonB-dependent receptor plug domain-containing protein, partial [Woeseiaceae bacterium]